MESGLSTRTRSREATDLAAYRREADPPEDVAGLAEQTVLGARMQGTGPVPDAYKVAPTDFSTPVHVTIALAIEACERAGEAVDPLIVLDELTRGGHAAECGGITYLQDLALSIPSAAAIAAHVGIVRAKAKERAHALARSRIAALAQGGCPVAEFRESVAEVMKGLDDDQPAPGSGLVLTVAELHARANNAAWAVKWAIPAVGIGTIFGASGAFKSFVALDYVLHRAYGMPWLGRRTRKAIPVYLAAEGGASIMRRIEAWHQARGLDWRNCPMRVVVTPLTLRTEAGALRHAITATGITPGDIVIDTMSQTYTGSENSNDEVADYLRAIGAELRDAFQCTVSVVHHTGHVATDRPRGASAIIANLDFAIGVFRDQDQLLCTAEWVKLKDAERLAPQTFQLTSVDLGEDEDGDPITSLVARHVTNGEEMQAAMRREATSGRGGRNQLLLGLIHAGMTEKELRKAFYEDVDIADADTKKKAFYRAREWAEKAGFIEIAGQDHRVIVLREFN